MDAITGTAGNDTINATLDTAGTWTGLDGVDGAGATDTLKINSIIDYATPAGATVSNVETVNISAAAKMGTFGALGTANVDLSTLLAGVTTLTVTGSTEADFKAPSTAAVTLTNGTGGIELSGGASQTVTLAAQGGNLNLLGSTGAISATSTSQGTNTMVINGGSTVTVSTNFKGTAAATQGAITIGGTTKPTGAVSITNAVTNNGSDVAGAGNVVGSAITVTGGTTVTVAQTAVQSIATTAVANNQITQGKVIINGAAGFTSATVSQSAAATAVNTRLAVAAVTESTKATFVALTGGQDLSLNGLTFKAGTAGTTAAETAAAFAGLDVGAKQGYSTKGTYSGTFDTANFTSGAVSTADVTFTGSSAGARGNITAGGSGTAPSLTNTDGVTSVSARGTGAIVQGVVEIDDTGTEADTLTTASVTGFSGASFVKSDALTALTLAKSTEASTMTVTNATAASTLALTVDTLAAANVSIDGSAGKYTTLNITTTGGDSKETALTAASVTALTVDGTKAIDLTGSTLTAMKTLTVKGSAGVTVDASGANVTAVDTTGTTGTNTITVDATLATYTGGAGVDSVTTSAAAPSKVINLGLGDDTLTLATGTTSSTAIMVGGDGTDTLKMAVANAETVTGAATFQTFFTGFEKFSLTGAASGAAATVDMANMNNINYAVWTPVGTTTAVKEKQTIALTTVSVASTETVVVTVAGNAVTYTNASGGAVASAAGALATALKGALEGNATFVASYTATVSTNDLVIEQKATAESDIAAITVTGTGITVADTFTVTETTKGVAGVTASGLLTLSNFANGGSVEIGGANAGATVNVKDAATGTADSLNIKLVSGSSLVAGTITAANVETLTLASTDSDTSSGSNSNTATLVATKATSLTITGNAALDLTNSGNVKLATINAGGMTAALTVIAAGTVASVITGGTGDDVLTASTGATSMGDTLIGGDGADTLTSNSAMDTLTGGNGFDTFVIKTASTNVNSYATITDATKGDYVQFTSVGTPVFIQTKVTLGDTAVFQDYANAAINTLALGEIGWFQFAGNTYVVQDGNAAAGGNGSTFVNGDDYIVKLTGLVDLTLASFDTTDIMIRIGGTP